MLKIYEYKNCSTCKKAIKFLDSSDLEYKAIPIVDQPPSKAEIKKMLSYLDGDIKKLFNTSGQVYREMGLKEQLPNMSSTEAIELLSEHGKLIKRPFLIGKDFGTVGFKEDRWSDLLL
ncbi:arsenate reductase family protein [Pseudobacteriovorax antillogorgiicola]|uniref:Arsenate reductase n=1 Tax=Pseudobacteriovorax antillogorgiicola TaxID=1513793 RepID=A0A1Y6BAK1_9BACT|nr:arsenate reductase family protein [Pseudobacteriovorax antillogorgiicola]TCS59214.1 arsenate reductase/hypothetical protein [Pseudobacteriovorax antillogorgiicola]SME90478.1 arsenate reductase/hypothetical protein [Pseudobacteriovorax antillogorgiicola]